MTTVFSTDLARWGPDVVGWSEFQGQRNAPPNVSRCELSIPSVDAARAYCRELATRHYENFPVLSCALPRSLRQHFANVYAYCRWADDLGDEVDSTDRSLECLAWWRNELAACYVGVTRHPVFVALRQTIDEFHIPIEPFDDLISAFEQDQRVLEYESFNELHDYCRRSANPVGRLVLFLCRAHTEQNVKWSDAVCTGLQLANFWQDVQRDLTIGRVYLPREDRRRFGYSDNDLINRVTNPAFLELMRFQVDRAREFLNQGLPLATVLHGRLQIVVELFIRGGLRILDRIQTIEYRVWDSRPVVTRLDFAALLIGTIWRAMTRGVFHTTSTAQTH